MPKKILIVDDDQSIVDAVSIILEDANYSVISTRDGKETFSLLRKKPDLILLDILMSGSDGREICERLKKNQKTKNIPVVFISANKNTEELAAKLKADDFLLKPFDVNELLGKIKNLIG